MDEQELSLIVSDVEIKNHYEEIRTSSQLDQAGIYLKFVGAKIKELNDTRLSITRPLVESKKKTMELFAKPVNRLKDISDEIKKTITTYQIKTEALLRVEEDRLKEVAEDKAEKERKEAMDRATELEQAGHIDGAEDVLEVSVNIVPDAVVVPVIRTKPTGVTMRVNWKFMVSDITKVPLKYLKVDDVALGQSVREHNTGNKGDVSRVEIPGVEIYYEKSMY